MARRLLRLTLIGFALRILLLPYTGESDLGVFGEASQSMVQGGGPYSYIIVYPPDWEYYLNLVGIGAWGIGGGPLLTTNTGLLVYHARLGFAQPAYIVVPIYAVLEKLPLILADFLVAGLLFFIVRGATGSADRAIVAFGLWFLNPLVITDSALHGAFDVLPVAFSVAAFYLLDHRRWASAGASLGLATAFKVYPIFLFPIALLLTWRVSRKEGARLPRSSLILTAAFTAVAAVPFALPGTLSEYLAYSSTAPSNGEEFWGFGIFSWLSVPVINAPGAWISAHTDQVLVVLGVVALLMMLGVLTYLFRARETGAFSPLTLYGCFAAIYASWLLSPSIHPQYVEWMLPILILLYAIRKELGIVLFAASVLPVVFYFFDLGNPLIFFQPLGLYTSVVPLAPLLSAGAFWGPPAPVIDFLTTVPASAALLYALWVYFRKLKAAGERA